MPVWTVDKGVNVVQFRRGVPHCPAMPGGVGDLVLVTMSQVPGSVVVVGGARLSYSYYIMYNAGWKLR